MLHTMYLIFVFSYIQNVKDEYLRSRAYIRLSLSSPFPSVIVSQHWTLSRYLCLYLGSLHSKILKKWAYLNLKYCFGYLYQPVLPTILILLICTCKLLKMATLIHNNFLYLVKERFFCNGISSSHHGSLICSGHVSGTSLQKRSNVHASIWP